MDSGSIALRTSKYRYCWLIVVIILVFATIAAYFALNQTVGVIRTYYTGIEFLVLIPIFGLLYIFVKSETVINSITNQQYPENLDTDTTYHDAIVIVHSMDLSLSLVYCGVATLTETLKDHKYPFKIYHCYCPTDFIRVLENKNAQYIWIFGHGWRGGITFKWGRTLLERLTFVKRKTNFAYEDLYKNSGLRVPKKEFIGQFHCNHIVNDLPRASLPEIIMDSGTSENKYYVTNHKNNVLTIWLDIRDLMKDITQTRRLTSTQTIEDSISTIQRHKKRM